MYSIWKNLNIKSNQRSIKRNHLTQVKSYPTNRVTISIYGRRNEI